MSFLTPAEVYETMIEANFKKTQGSLFRNFILGLLGGGYVALGGLAYVVAITGTADKLGLGASKILGGVVFSLGLILVVIAGAQLFTGNTMILGAKLEKKVKIKDLFSNWVLVYFTNFLGAILVVALIYFAGIYGYKDNLTDFGNTIVKVAKGKMALSSLEIFMRGILANWLVCLAVYLSYSAKDIVGKITAILFPITIFVAIGLEHCIANMSLLTGGWILDPEKHGLTLGLFWHNLFFSTLGNIVGGAFFVATIYFWAFGRQKTAK